MMKQRTTPIIAALALCLGLGLCLCLTLLPGTARAEEGPTTLTEEHVTLSKASATYNGLEQKPTVTVKDSGTLLTEGTDYTVAFQQGEGAFRNAGAYTVTVTGQGGYTGSVEKTFTIEKAEPIVRFSAYNFEKTYDGLPIQVEFTVTLKNNEVYDGPIIYWFDNKECPEPPVDAGRYAAYIVIPEQDNYKRGRKGPLSLRINKADQTAVPAAPVVKEVTGTSVTLEAIENAEYSNTDGASWQPRPTFTGLDPGREYTFHARLKESTNYNPSPSSAGTTVTTKRIALENAYVEVYPMSYAYTGAAIVPEAKNVTVRLDGKEINSNQYTISAGNNVNAGNATLTVTAREDGGCTGSVSTTFYISLRVVGITAEPQRITYGESIAQGVDQVEIMGGELVQGHTLAGVTLTAKSDQVSERENRVTPSAARIEDTGGGDVTSNYLIVYIAGSLTIDPAPLTITEADAVSREYQPFNPYVFLSRVTLEGFVNGETLTFGKDYNLWGVSEDEEKGWTAGEDQEISKWKYVPGSDKARNYSISENHGFTTTVTITKAPPTGAPKHTAISASGKTLADAGLTTEGGTFDTKGTVAWVLPGDTEVTANTEYEWIFTPDDTDNYNTLTGKLTPWKRSTGGGGGGGGSGGSSLPVTTTGQGGGTTTTTAAPTATVQGGTASTAVSTTMGNEIVKQAVDNKSENVVIAPSVTGSVTKTEVSIPASTVGQLGSQTGASLTVSTPVAEVTIPNGGLGSLGSAGGTVTVTAGQAGNTVELTVTAGGKTVERVPGGVTLTVPVEHTTPGTVAVLVHPDGTREVVRKSVADGDSVTIPLEGSAKLELVDNSKEFFDVPATGWQAEAAAFVSSHELFSGTAPGRFSPNAPMSRGMLAVVLHNLERNPAQAFTGVFADVDGGQWYAGGVAWAEAQGIIGGYGNGRFGPNDNVTREQLAVMLWRYAGSPAATVQGLNFADADKTSGWAVDALRWAAEKGILSGRGDGILDSAGQATRAETARMLMNFLEKR